MPKYRYIGNTPQEVHVGDKRIMLAPGDFVDITDKDLALKDNATVAEQLLSVDKKGGSSSE